MELLNEKGLVPDLPSGNEDIVIAINEDLRSAAMSVATKLRASGRLVDLVLDDKRMKWAFRHAERTGAQRLVMVMPDEWAAGNVRIKELESGEESDVALSDLYSLFTRKSTSSDGRKCQRSEPCDQSESRDGV